MDDVIDIKRNELLSSIIDKLHGYEITKKKVFIRTIPSTIYPKGKSYNGQVRFVLSSKGKFSFIDDKNGIIEIYFTEIASPTDIQDSKKETTK